MSKTRRARNAFSRARLGVESLEGREVPAALSLIPPGTAPNGDTQESALSADGQFVAFSTAATNTVTGVTDANGGTDVYLLDRATGTTTLVSRSAASATTTANGASFTPRISADGRFVVYQSDATNLVTGQTDTNAATDVFLFDRTTGTNTLVSRSTAGATTTGNDASTPADISGNGQFVVFTSFATDLVTGVTDTNANSDVFLYDVATGAVTLVSRSAASATTTANGISENASISTDGNVIAYESGATDLVTGQTDTNANLDVFVFNRTAGTTTLASHTSAGAATTGNDFSYNPQVSGGGTAVVFISQATDLVAGQTGTAGTQNVFLYNVAAGTDTLVSGSGGSATATGNGGSFYDRSASGVRQRVISDDGTVVVYTSSATDLISGGTDANGATDVFAFDSAAGATTLISRATTGATTAANGASANGAVSANGQVVAFDSAATDLTSGTTDTNTGTDVFVTGVKSPAPLLVSSSSTGGTTAGNGASTFPLLSGSGTVGTFVSAATDLLSAATTGTQTFLFAANLPPRPLVVSGLTNGSAILLTPNPATGQYSTTPAATLAPFGGFAGNVRAAVADVDGDGIPDTILVTGPGAGPTRFAVISGKDNTTVLVPPTDPFGNASFTGGGFVSAGDLDNDGRAEWVITPDQGGGPNVVIYSLVGTTATLRKSFFGIDDPAFRGGARSAIGDVNDDGTADLAVAAGFLGGPRVALFDGKTVFGTPTRLVGDFFAFDGPDAVTLRNGVFVAIGDLDGDGFGDLIFGGGPGGGPRVLAVSGKTLVASGIAGAQAAPLLNFFVAGDSTDRGGVRVAATNADGDNKADLVVGSGEGLPSRVRVYLGKNISGSTEPATVQDIDPFGQTLAGGVFVG
jgi:hypothetical protein